MAPNHWCLPSASSLSVRTINQNPASERHLTRGGVLCSVRERTTENRCAQLAERTRSREYKSSDQHDHERKQHKVTQEQGHTEKLAPKRNCRRLDSRLSNSKFCTAVRSKTAPRSATGAISLILLVKFANLPYR